MPIEVYTDGSYRSDGCRWGFIAIDGDQELFRLKGVIPAHLCESHNIDGELTAVIEAVRWAKNKGIAIDVVTDLQGVFSWVGDFFGGSRWKTNKDLTKNYRKFIGSNLNVVRRIKVVKGHSGNRWNEAVDKFLNSQS